MRSAQRARPGIGSAILLLAVMDVAPRVAGLARALRVADWLAGTRVRSASPQREREDTDAIARTLATAAAFYPRRALCLEQSLALYVLLRRHGIAARVQIGVQPLPFYAHAWVEVDGRPISEGQGRIEQLVTFQMEV